MSLRREMGYIQYQALNGGKPVKSKTKMRKQLRRGGLGKGGCTPAFKVRSARHLSTTPTRASSSSGGAGTQLAGHGSGSLPKGWKAHDPFGAYCHKNHFSDYYPTRVHSGDKLACRE